MTIPYWAIYTLLGAMGQTLRNASQRELIGTLGPIGASQVRFLYGLPFSFIFLALALGATGAAFPHFSTISIAWAIFGACSQIVATALMLAAMRARSFVVAVAYTKTEAVQVALFALIFLGEKLTIPVLSAVFLATIGVVLLSWKGGIGEARDRMPALFGLSGAAFFAFAAVGFRGAIRSLPTGDYIAAASATLVVGLAIQTALLATYLAIFDRPGARAILKAWRPSLFAGFMGALASQFWFLAFALSDVAKVRTLALIEVPFAQLISLRLFREPMTARDLLGIALIVVGAALVLSA